MSTFAGWGKLENSIYIKSITHVTIHGILKFQNESFIFFVFYPILWPATSTVDVVNIFRVDSRAQNAISFQMNINISENGIDF